VSHRYVVIYHDPDFEPLEGPGAVWYDADQHQIAQAFAMRVSHREKRRVRVQKIEMGVCGCGPASVTDGVVTIFSDAWGECHSAGGPDCACGCHELEGMLSG